MQNEMDLIGGEAENPKPTGPDWEGFGRAIIKYWPRSEVPVDELQQWAENFRIIRKVPGGFDPDLHEDEEGYCKPGDEWYEFNFRG